MAEGGRRGRDPAVRARVAFDLDNVVFDIMNAALRVKAADIGIATSDITMTWKYHDPFSHSDPDVHRLLRTDHDFWMRDDMLASCLPLVGAVEALNRLHDAGMLVAYVTRRSGTSRIVTERCLRSAGCPPVTLSMVGDVDAGRNHAVCKARTCLDLGATHLVDDSQSEIASALAEGMRGILVDHPLGREARNQWRRSHASVPLASDAAHAVEMILAEA